MISEKRRNFSFEKEKFSICAHSKRRENAKVSIQTFSNNKGTDLFVNNCQTF